MEGNISFVDQLQKILKLFHTMLSSKNYHNLEKNLRILRILNFRKKYN